MLEAYVFEKTLKRKEAYEMALNKNDSLWGVVFKNLPLTEMRLMYIEYFLLTMETTKSTGLPQLVLGSKAGPVKKKLLVLVNGTTGTPALVRDHPKILIKEFEDDSRMQHSAITEEEAVTGAKKLVRKVTHRLMGGLHEAELVERISVYRPFWVAFYGEVKEGNKVRYITIPADGGENSRVR